MDEDLPPPPKRSNFDTNAGTSTSTATAVIPTSSTASGTGAAEPSEVFTEEETPRFSIHANIAVPSDVRTARHVVLQCLSESDIDEAEQVIGTDQPLSVPNLCADESLFNDSEIEKLSENLDFLTVNTREKQYENQLRLVLEQIIGKLKASTRLAAPQLQAITMLHKTNRNVPARRQHEENVNNVTYESGVEDIQVGLDDDVGHKRTTLLLIEVKKHYEDYPQSAGSNAASNVQCHLDIVYQCIMYAIRSQRSILRTVTDNKFVLVSLVMFRNIAFLVKLTAAEWWSYSYDLKVQKYKLASALDVVNVLQLYVLGVFAVNAYTNQWLGDQVQQDFTQLYVPAHEIAYPSYPAHVRHVPKVRLNHIRMCSLRDCVETLIQHSTVYWPNLEAEAKVQFELQFERKNAEFERKKAEFERKNAEFRQQQIVLFERLIEENNAESRESLLVEINLLKSRISALKAPSSAASNNELQASSNVKLLKNAWCSQLLEDGETQVVVKVVSALNYSCALRAQFTDSFQSFLQNLQVKVNPAPEAAKYVRLLDFHLCICSRKANKMSSVVVTRYTGECICAHDAFLEDWKKQRSLARVAFTEQVCNEYIDMLQEGFSYYHGDFRPANITVDKRQNRYVFTVIDWDNFRECGTFLRPTVQDNFYPYTRSNSSETEQLASAAYTAYQLLLTVYILHRASGSGRDKFERANEAEFYLRTCGPLHQTDKASGDTASGDATANRSCSNSNSTSIMKLAQKRPKNNPKTQERAAIERSKFQAWTLKMGVRFTNLTKWLTDQNGCTFDLLRNYLLFAVNCEFTADAESPESVVPIPTESGSRVSRSRGTTAAVPASNADQVRATLKRRAEKD